MKHEFTKNIIGILEEFYGTQAQAVLDQSSLLQYLNIKTRSANRGSKARGAFANHYALFVLVEDYINKGYLADKAGQYEKYEGARFTDLFRRQRELPFGSKLQNHALNARLNDEFVKYFPTLELRPILRDPKEQRYWINEKLLMVKVIENKAEVTKNIAPALIRIINEYVATKKSAFEAFLEVCSQIATLSEKGADEALAFVIQQLDPNVDARVFEIVSFAVLKIAYGEKAIYWGWSQTSLKREVLMLYKTGRTNANDGGIDFVMRPLGRFFQVTETIDVNKYFLDIDKIQRFPLTFVIKTSEAPETIMRQLQEQALKKYGIEQVVNRYMESVEEIINIPILIDHLKAIVENGQIGLVMEEVILQSKVEFNYGDEELEADTSDLPSLN